MTDWDARLTIGTRVVIRHRLAQADAAGHTLTDVVGTLTALDPDSLTVHTRRGEVQVPRPTIVAAKVIPPQAARRARISGGDLSPGELHRLLVDAWPPMESEELGDWLLRAARGFTQRANSVLTVGSPKMPYPEAVDHVERWYAARGLPANLCLVGPTSFDVARDSLGELLLGRGYLPRVRTHTLVAEVKDVASCVGTPTARVRTQPFPEDRWMQAYAAYRPIDPVAAQAILTGSPAQVFADITIEGSIAAIGRLAVSGQWAGISAVWVDPSRRRQGLATDILAALVAHAANAGTTHLHLQTDEDNTAALAAYEKVGFRRHHSYVNLRAPGE